MHPILFTFGESGFIGTYGLMVAAGLLVSIQLAAWRARKRGLSADAIYDLALCAVISGFLSARLLYIFLNFRGFLESPADYVFSRSGFVFLGGFVGAALCCIAFLQWKRMPVLLTADTVVPSLALGHAFGRIGCHLAGCCWGGVCSVEPLAIRMGRHIQPDGYPFENALEAQIAEGLLAPDATLSLPIWPVQLLEAFGLAAICGGLILYGMRDRTPGRTLAMYLIAYPILRFALEFLRGDLYRGVFGALSTSQILSLAILPVGVWLWVKAGRDARKAAATRPQSAPTA